MTALENVYLSMGITLIMNRPKMQTIFKLTRSKGQAISMRKHDMIITNGAAWSIEFWANGGYFDTRKKSLETRSETECF